MTRSPKVDQATVVDLLAWRTKARARVERRSTVTELTRLGSTCPGGAFSQHGANLLLRRLTFMAVKRMTRALRRHSRPSFETYSSYSQV